MKLEEIKDVINSYFNETKLKVYEIAYDNKDSILTILLDEKMDMDKIEEVSNDLSVFLDKYEDLFDDNYILDVSTVGVERPIKTKEELNKAVGSYVYIKTKNEEYNGTLLKLEDELIELEIKDKTRVKQVCINLNDVKTMRYAVKF